MQLLLLMNIYVIYVNKVLCRSRWNVTSTYSLLRPAPTVHAPIRPAHDLAETALVVRLVAAHFFADGVEELGPAGAAHARGVRGVVPVGARPRSTIRVGTAPFEAFQLAALALVVYAHVGTADIKVTTI